MTLRFKHSSLNFFDFKECYHGFYLATLRLSRRKVSNAMSVNNQICLMKILIFTFLGSTGFISGSLAPGALLRIIEDLNWLSKWLVFPDIFNTLARSTQCGNNTESCEIE